MQIPLNARFLLLVCFLVISSVTKAQPGALDTTFNTLNLGAGSQISTTCLLPDGRVMIGGDFTGYNGLSRGRIARIFSEGTLDTTFAPPSGANANVRTIAVQPDGKIVAAGSFTEFNGNAHSYIVRLNADGTTDTTFQMGSGFNNFVNSVLVRPNGKIIVGGFFTAYNGVNRNYLIQLNEDGSIDNAFSGSTNAEVMSMALQPDGKLLIGGSFTMIQGSFILAYRFARLNENGTLDIGFSTNVLAGASSFVMAISLRNDGHMVIGGEFVNFNNIERNRIAKIQSNGEQFQFPIDGGVNDMVEDIAIQPDNKSIICGRFTSQGQGLSIQAINRIIRLNELYGDVDSSFNPGSGANNSIKAVNYLPQNKALIAGEFTNYNGTPAGRIARIFLCNTPAPQAIQGPDTILCSQTATYFVPSVPEATVYQWSLPNGWVGSSTSNSITVQTGGSGTLSVRAWSDSCGWSNPSEVFVHQITVSTPEICLVTVDSLSSHNLVIWEKETTSLIDSFFIYRETSTNVYTKIASVPYDSLSQYRDYGANPNITNYRYRISALDGCGTETPLSPYHSTIHLQNLGGGNFQWTFYQIEGQPNPVVNYRVFRDNFSDNNFQQVGFISGNSSTFFDPTFSSFQNSRYVVDVDWLIGCTPTRTVNTTRSNIRHRNELISATQRSISPLSVYPNPSSQTCKLTSSEPITEVWVTNALGQEVFRSKTFDSQLPVHSFQAGIYCVFVRLSSGVHPLKLVVESVQ